MLVANMQLQLGSILGHTKGALRAREYIQTEGQTGRVCVCVFERESLGGVRDRDGRGSVCVCICVVCSLLLLVLACLTHPAHLTSVASTACSKSLRLPLLATSTLPLLRHPLLLASPSYS